MGYAKSYKEPSTGHDSPVFSAEPLLIRISKMAQDKNNLREVHRDLGPFFTEDGGIDDDHIPLDVSAHIDRLKQAVDSASDISSLAFLASIYYSGSCGVGGQNAILRNLTGRRIRVSVRVTSYLIGNQSLTHTAERILGPNGTTNLGCTRPDTFVPGGWLQRSYTILSASYA